MYSIFSANEDFGLMYCSKEFELEKALFRKKNNEIIELFSLEELWNENKKEHDMTIRDFYLQYLELISGRYDLN